MYLDFDTTATVASAAINSALVGNYLLVNTLGGSFTAVNKFFQLSQTVALDANALYELKFSIYFDFSPCGTPIPDIMSFPIEILIGNKLSTTFARIVNIFPNKIKYVIYLIPTTSGILPLSVACALPCRTKYYFDIFSLKKITNISTNIEGYRYFQVNETKSDITHSLPLLPIDWYFLNPKNKIWFMGEFRFLLFLLYY